MVRISASQADNPGSNPGRRSYLFIDASLIVIMPIKVNYKGKVIIAPKAVLGYSKKVQAKVLDDYYTKKIKAARQWHKKRQAGKVMRPYNQKQIGKWIKSLQNVLYKLYNSGVIKNGRHITGNLGEYLVSKKFGAKDVSNSHNKFPGVDLLLKHKKIQVKTRALFFDENHSGGKELQGFHKTDKFDVVWAVFLGKNLRLKEVWEIPRKTVNQELGKDGYRFCFNERVKKESKQLFP